MPAELRTEASAPAEEPRPGAVPEPEPEPRRAGRPGPLTVPPAQVTVNVLNGTGTTGLAATVADALRAQGFVVGTVGNEPGTVNESVVRHGPNVLEQARTVAAAVPGAVLQPSDAIGETVQLVIGPGFANVVPVEVGGPRARRRPPPPPPRHRPRRPRRSAAAEGAGSAEAAGDVVLGGLLVGVAEDLLGRVELDQPARLADPGEVEEAGRTRSPGRPAACCG